MFGKKIEERVIIREVVKAPKDGYVQFDEFVDRFSTDTVEHQVRASLILRFKQYDPTDSDNGCIVYLKDGTTLYVKDDCETILDMIEGATD